MDNNTVFCVFWTGFKTQRTNMISGLLSLILCMRRVNTCSPTYVMSFKLTKCMVFISCPPKIKLNSIANLNEIYVSVQSLITGKFLTVMLSCLRFIWITNISDHRRVRTENLLQAK